MNEFPHLNEQVALRVRDLPEERIDFIQSDQWVGYEEAKKILQEFDDLVRHPRNMRMPCRVLVGNSQNGKTTLLRRCCKLHPVEYTEDEQIVLPVLLFETPPEPDEGRLYSSILTALAVAHRQDAAPERLLAKVVDRLTLLNVRLLMADEFHNILQGTPRNQRQCLASLKSLLNTLKMPFVAAGISDVMTALATDTQFVSRFEKLELPKWGSNKPTRRMIMSLETVLPLAKPSGLAEEKMAIRIIGASGDTLGGIVDIVKKAAVAAIQNNKECIDMATLEAVIAERAKRIIW